MVFSMKTPGVSRHIRHSIAMYRALFAILITFLVLAPTQVSAATTVTYSSTSEFDGGVKSAAPSQDATNETVTITDNPAGPTNALALAAIRADGFGVADADVDTWRWTPSTEGCSGLGTPTVGIANGELSMSITRTGGSTAWGYVKASYVVSGNLDVRVFVDDVSAADSDEVFDFGLYTIPNGCYFNAPSPDGVIYRALRTCASSTCLRLQAFTVTAGITTQIGADTDVADLSLCLRIARVTNAWTWYYDTASICSSWTSDETTTFAVTPELHMTLAISDQVGTSDAAAFEFDDFYAPTGTIRIVGREDVELSDTYGGTVDYDPQIFSNAKGELVSIWGVGQAMPNEAISMRWSKTRGATWSDRVVLFDDAPGNPAVISNTVSGMWEFGGEVRSDVLYLVFHLCPTACVAGQRNGFTKINIADVRNIETYSNWQSADGDRVPSVGGGSDGRGYDLISGLNYIDPSIAVNTASDILVAQIRDAAPQDTVYVNRWNGVSWSGPNLLYDANLPIGLARLRRIQDGDWVAAFQIQPVDTFTYAVTMRCDAASTCTSSANWHGMDGAGTFDYTIDSGAGAFGWPMIYADSNGNVHVTASTQYLISGFRRLWHNVWNGAAWANGEAENAAGARIDFTISATSEPRVSTGTENHFFNVDSGGNVIMLLDAANGPSGAGFYSLFYTGGAWVSSSYRLRTTSGSGNIVGEGYMRGMENTSPFLVANGNDIRSIVVPGATSGSPWWDAIPGAASSYEYRVSGSWQSATTLLTSQRITSLVLNHSSLTAGAYIDRTAILRDGSVIWSSATDIVTGTQTTFYIFLTVTGQVAVNVTFGSLGGASPVLESIAYSYVPYTFRGSSAEAWGWLLWVVLTAVGFASLAGGPPPLRACLILAGMLLIFLAIDSFGTDFVPLFVVGLGTAVIQIFIGALALIFAGES